MLLLIFSFLFAQPNSIDLAENYVPKYECKKKEHLGKRFFIYELRNLDISVADNLKVKIWSRMFTCRKTFWDGYHWRDEGYLPEHRMAYRYQGTDGEFKTVISEFERNESEDYEKINLYESKISFPITNLNGAGDLSQPQDLQLRFYVHDIEEDTFSHSYYKLSFLLSFSERSGYSMSEEAFIIVNPVSPDDPWNSGFKTKSQQELLAPLNDRSDYDFAICWDNGTEFEARIDAAPPSEVFPYYKTLIRFFRNNRRLGGFNSTTEFNAETNTLTFRDTKFSDPEAVLNITFDPSTLSEKNWMDGSATLSNWSLPGTNGENFTCKVHLRRADQL